MRLKNAEVKIFRHFWFCLEFGGWYSVNIPHLVTSHASHQSSHVLPFQLSGVTAQPLYSFFQGLELAAPMERVMWAARLRPEPVAGCLACFFWPSWKLDPGRSGG